MADNKISFWQKFYDNYWLLLVLGVLVPTLIYTVWGVLEILNVPELPLK